MLLFTPYSILCRVLMDGPDKPHRCKDHPFSQSLIQLHTHTHTHHGVLLPVHTCELSIFYSGEINTDRARGTTSRPQPIITPEAGRSSCLSNIYRRSPSKARFPVQWGMDTLGIPSTRMFLIDPALYQDYWLSWGHYCLTCRQTRGRYVILNTTSQIRNQTEYGVLRST